METYTAYHLIKHYNEYFYNARFIGGKFNSMDITKQLLFYLV